MTPRCIVIVGPTAVGKTAIAIRLAEILKTQIISADSRQCYQELNIGVGKPSPQQLQETHHYFVNSHSIRQAVNAAMFEQYALTSIDKIFEGTSHAIVVGGTGLYINAFCNGMDDVPAILPEVRNHIISCYNRDGISWLQEELRNVDPGYFDDGEILNPQRLMRALEVKLSTGRPIKSYHTGQKRKRNFTILKVGLELPREILYHQINSRVEEMMENGLEQEVKSLLPFRNLNALNTVGYKELFDFFDQKISLSEAVELVKKNTRHYAKRQLTWFKKDESVHWIHPGNVSAIVDLLKR